MVLSPSWMPTAELDADATATLLHETMKVNLLIRKGN